jgi:hypothetical protein
LLSRFPDETVKEQPRFQREKKTKTANGIFDGPLCRVFIVIYALKNSLGEGFMLLSFLLSEAYVLQSGDRKDKKILSLLYTLSNEKKKITYSCTFGIKT